MMNQQSHWLIVAVSEQLNDIKPLAACANGHEFVLFRDADGIARALENRCPHRRVPLSLGKLIDGAIRCAYHGWTFDGDSGACINIPNLGADERISPNYCAKTYPCREQGGFIYAWTAEGEPNSEPAFLFNDPHAVQSKVECYGAGTVALDIDSYRNALIDGPQALLSFTGVRFTDFFLGDAKLEAGWVIVDREAEWGDSLAPPTIKVTERPLRLRTELLAHGNGTVFRLLDPHEELLAQMILAFNASPRGTTSFCWRYQQTAAFNQAQPRLDRLKYARAKPATVNTSLEGSAIASLLVGPSYDYHKILSDLEPKESKSELR